MTERTPVPAEFRQPGATQRFPNKITEKQREYIFSLLESKQLPEREDMQIRVDALIKQLRISEDPEELGLEKTEASRIISWLLTLKWKPRKQQGSQSPWERMADGIPAGRYAVDSNDGELRFYQLWRPRNNNAVWKLYVLHGPDSSPVQRGAEKAILEKIRGVGVRNAAIRFGKEIGACSNCGRRLTNRISRELGIGPVCGGRMFDGDVWRAEVKSARQSIIDRGEDPQEELE